MKRNFGAEIDSLKKDMEEIKKLLQDSLGAAQNAAETAAETACKSVIQKGKMHPDPSVNDVMEKLEAYCADGKDSGAITYLGVFRSGKKRYRESRWIQNQVGTDALLNLIEDGTVTKVLMCIGSRERMNILLTLLKKPMTVTQLIEECGYNSTGQVYHLLRSLLNADLVMETEQKGVYAVKPQRVQGVIMLLAGIKDLVDTRVSSGTWEEEEDTEA